VPIDATAGDPVVQIREITGGKGVDVALELIGSGLTMGQAVRCLGILGRAAMVGLTDEPLSVRPYIELINKEAEVIGVSDHLASEFPLLMRLAQDGKLSFPQGALRSVELDAAQINAALDEVTKSTDHIRSVIVPTA
jgi:threonine dehydrogenase-like Zn-dependent dehydrogenase